MSKPFIEISIKKTGYITISDLPDELKDALDPLDVGGVLPVDYVKRIMPNLNKYTMRKLSDCDYIVFED